MVKSPSSQRAWIEIKNTRNNAIFYLVALLAEGVDRNKKAGKAYAKDFASPSSRRAWIEIFLTLPRDP